MGMQCQCPQCGVAFIIPTIDRGQQTPAVQTTAAAPQIDLAPIPEDDLPSRSAAATGLEGLDVGELDTGELGAAAVGETLLHIPCPNGHELEVPLDMLGQRAMCPHCQVEFRLRREKSVEYLRQQEILDRKRAEFWFKLAIVAACVVGIVLLVMFAAMMLS
jgi:hypothetical protein